MPIELLGVGTDRRHGRFQLPTPNNSIGPSEVARDGFKVGWIRLPLVGGRFLKTPIGSDPPNRSIHIGISDFFVIDRWKTAFEIGEPAPEN